jgi:hypothetical protein
MTAKRTNEERSFGTMSRDVEKMFYVYLLPIVAVCCMWDSRAICEDGLYNIAKVGLRDLPRVMTAIGWFGLNDFLRLRQDCARETDQTVATGEEGRFDRTGKSDLGRSVAGMGWSGGTLSGA